MVLKKEQSIIMNAVLINIINSCSSKPLSFNIFLSILISFKIRYGKLLYISTIVKNSHRN